METILLDTDVYSYLIRRSDTRGEIYRPLVEDKRIALSFISVGELYVWSVKRKWGGRALAAFEEKLAATMIIPSDLDLCREYGRVKAGLPPGTIIPPNDLWIAVSAIRQGMPLLTHNRRHFHLIPGLRLLI